MELNINKTNTRKNHDRIFISQKKKKLLKKMLN